MAKLTPDSNTSRVKYVRSLDLLVADAEAMVQELWDSTAGMPTARREAVLRAGLRDIIETFGDQAGQTAQEYLWAEWRADGRKNFAYPRPAPAIPDDQITGSVDWAIQTKKGGLENPNVQVMAADRLKEVAGRLIMQQPRTVVQRSTIQTKYLWCRLPEPGACDFCIMLGGRVYSAKTVLTTRDGGSYHGHCRCKAVQAKSKKHLPKINRVLHDGYQTYIDEQAQDRLARAKDGTTKVRSLADIARDVDGVDLSGALANHLINPAG